MIYILLFVAYACFPLLLAGYGAHIGAAATKNKKLRGKQLLLIWGLASAGVIVSGVAQHFSYRSDAQRDATEQNFRAQIQEKLNLIIAEPDSARKKVAARNLKQQLEQHADLEPNLNKSHPETRRALSPNDISVVVCNNLLKLNTGIHSSTKSDGPWTCSLMITSKSSVMLKNALLQISVAPRTTGIATVPTGTMVPASDGIIEDESIQIPISQTVVKGGLPFMVILKLPYSFKRYEIQINIIKDDGRLLGWWAVDMIPLHESD